VRNTASAYWRPSIANKAQRCIVPATAFAERGLDAFEIEPPSLE
jgi:hypothetical protein